MTDHSGERVVFAQLSNFSNTNALLDRHLGQFLDGRRLDVVRIWPIFRRNPLWLAIGVIAALWYHGLGRLKERGALIEAIIKTPIFFRLASFIARRKIAAQGPAYAVLQTQGLFDAGVPDTPLVVYTDDVILNPVNAAYLTSELLPGEIALERRLYAHADRIAVAATHVARSLEAQYGIGADKVVTVLMGANVPSDTGATDLSLARYAARRILFVGIDWPRKGGPDLVAAFRRLAPRFPDARLVIAGASPPLDDPAIEVLGSVAPERVAALMDGCSIFCMPSRAEPFGIATVEAARHGLPSIGTTTGGFADTVIDGRTGLLIPPGDVDALEAALTRLLADPELCRTMGRDAAEWATRRFDWRSVSKHLADVIDDAAHARHAA
ncbi:glycosyltransferase family 1 protein [Siculibacillus lacustris]|uniref:Glycosyltransferase family 1 protein n=1 Tax=Siculibacillus lacustris TaxID=1549641 RepID=A0A4Q9VIM8_9HYPH|nr:glycosyltransferase family 4 protein [Siculibacillus lacustris]TBW35098.1 glycosyltransferase family 1 protein [Siculibacillus lacustris]